MQRALLFIGTVAALLVPAANGLPPSTASCATAPATVSVGGIVSISGQVPVAQTFNGITLLEIQEPTLDNYVSVLTDNGAFTTTWTGREPGTVTVTVWGLNDRQHKHKILGSCSFDVTLA